MINIWIKLSGVLITSAIAFWILGRVYLDAEWKSLFRSVMQETEQRSSFKNTKSWYRYLSGIEKNMHILDKPFDRRKTTAMVGTVFVLFFCISLVLRYMPVFGFLLSSFSSLFLVYRFYANKAKRREEMITFAFLYEAVPAAVHVLTATNRLDQAFTRMAAMVRYEPLKRRLLSLEKIAQSPQFPTPEDAFVWFADRMGIAKIKAFALATREAKKYQVPLAQLWLDMTDFLGKDLEYVRNMRAQTSHHRKGGIWFYGMLAAPLLAVYPFTQNYMSETTKTAFWIALGVMTLGLYLIIRDSQVIDA